MYCITFIVFIIVKRYFVLQTDSEAVRYYSEKMEYKMEYKIVIKIST